MPKSSEAFVDSPAKVFSVRFIVALLLIAGGIGWILYYYLGVRPDPTVFPAEEGWGPMGVGAEVVTRVIEHAFDYLDAPPVRVHQEDVPLPYAANLEALSLPGVDKIVAAVKQVMA